MRNDPTDKVEKVLFYCSVAFMLLILILGVISLVNILFTHFQLL